MGWTVWKEVGVTICFQTLSLSMTSHAECSCGSYNYSAATKACLRLTAGCSFLKICDVTHMYARQVRKIYFFKMATLMTVSQWAGQGVLYSLKLGSLLLVHLRQSESL